MKNLSKIIVAGSLLSCATVQAAGLYLYETNTTDIGLASAGMAARAQDASVMAANPAGLANVSGQSFSGHLISLYGDAQLDTLAGDAGNVIGFVPMGSAFYSQKVNENGHWVSVYMETMVLDWATKGWWTEPLLN